MLNLYVSALELAAVLVSLFCFRNNGAVTKLISLLLLVTVVNEWWLVPVLAKQHHISRNVFYNLFSLIDITIWSTVFGIIHHRQRWLSAVILLGLGCLIYSIWELVFDSGWRLLHTNSMRAYSICVIVFCLLYFYAQFRKAYHNLTADWLFWLCTACFLFHSLLFVMLTTLARPDYFRIANAARFFFILHNLSNTLYYTLLITAFLVCRFRFFNKAPA